MKIKAIKKIRRYLVYLVVLVVRAVVNPLPFSVKSSLGSFFGALAHMMMKGAGMTAVGNIRMAFPELEIKEAEKIAEESFRNVGKNILEAIHLEKITPEEIQEITEYEGLEYFDEAMKEGRGVIAITGHMGNWEIFQAVITTLGYPSAVLAQRYSNPYIDKMITRIRNASGTNVIIRRRGKERELMRGVLKALADGNALGMLVDHYTKKGGIAVPFLNTETSAPAGPALFAMRTGSPVIFGYAMRMKNGRFKVKFQKPLKIINGKNRDIALYLNTAKFLQVIEEEIINYPEQWAWMHRYNRKSRKTVKRIKFDKVPEVLIFSKKGCCLCDDAKKIIEDVSMRYPLSFQSVDITDDEEKLKKYGNEVPVVFIEGKKLFKLGIDKKRFEERIIESLYYLYEKNVQEM